MPSPISFRFVSAALAATCLAAPAAAQSWGMVDMEGGGGAGAFVCPVDDAATGDVFCFRLQCSDAEPLHFAIDVAGGGGVGADLPVAVAVDGEAAGELTFAPAGGEGYLHLTAPFDPQIHRDLVARLRAGTGAALSLGWSTGSQIVAIGLAGSGETLGTVLDTCPAPALLVDDPAGLVRAEITGSCDGLGGTVALEPGFERREDLDGDGRADVVIDYASAVCSELASLSCGSGGCTVGFFLARDGGYARIFADTIRGYDVLPGGRLALDLHGTACGRFGYEACRKVYDVTGAAPVLVEELAGAAAEAAMAAGRAGDAPAGTEAPAAEADGATSPTAPEPAHP